MIGCDHCDEWYHTQCLSLTKDEVKRLSNENWSCPNCEFKKVKTKKRTSSDVSRSQTSLAVNQAQLSDKTNSTSTKPISPNVEKCKGNSSKLLSAPSLQKLCQDAKSLNNHSKRKRREPTDKGYTATLNPVVNENNAIQPSISHGSNS